MKKVSIYLCLALLFAGSYSAPATAASGLASSVSKAAAAYPRNDYFDYGFADGLAFLEYEASVYGGGSVTYNEQVDAEYERARQLEQSAVNGSDEQYYWYGYWVAIKQKRGNY